MAFFDQIVYGINRHFNRGEDHILGSFLLQKWPKIAYYCSKVLNRKLLLKNRPKCQVLYNLVGANCSSINIVQAKR